MPMVGFIDSEQHLTQHDGYQSVPQTGPYAGLNSTYEAQWTRPTANAVHFICR
jgi:hypothetical protein